MGGMGRTVQKASQEGNKCTTTYEVTSVSLKLGFGIGNRNQGPISVSVSEIFLTATETFF